MKKKGVLVLNRILKQLLTKTVYSSSPPRLTTIWRLFISGLTTIFRNNYLRVGPIPRKRRQCTQKIFICLKSLAYAILSIIKFRRLKLPSLEELGTKRTNFRWNLDIPTSKLALNRDLRNIPLKENVFTRTF